MLAIENFSESMSHFLIGLHSGVLTLIPTAYAPSRCLN